MSQIQDEGEQRWAHPSVLDTCFEGKMSMITDILKPVVTTMCIVLWLAWSLSSSNAFNPMQEQVSIATIAYTEHATDSTTTKLTGALMNALAFVLAVTVMTFGIVACIKYRCFKPLYCLIGMSALSALGSVSLLVTMNVLEAYHVPTDAFTFYYIMWNFAVVGMVAIFTPSPGWIKHGYLIAMSVLIAHIFSGLPQWTGWAILGALVLYDLAAVLCPHGPLNMLVEQAQEQNATIPGLLYEIDGEAAPADEAQEQRSAMDGEPAAANTPTAVPNGEPLDRLNELVAATSANQQDECDASPDEECGLLVNTAASSVQEPASDNNNNTGSGSGAAVEIEMHDGQHSSMGGTDASTEQSTVDMAQPVEESHQFEAMEGVADGFTTGEGGIKLGLGDFIFYSVLVAGAATDTVATTTACFVGIIFGMVGTIMLLAVFERALPALPISLTIGIILYFIFVGYASSNTSLIGKVAAFS